MAQVTPADWSAAPAVAPADASVPRRMVALQFGLAALLLVGYLALGWRGREPTDIGGSDELEYLALSQSIQQGSYREIYLADAPLAAKYPPAFPAWIALLQQISGDWLDSVLAANLVFLAGSLLLVFLVARHLLGGWWALGLLAICAVSPWVLETGGNKMSEAPFLFVTTLALYLAWRAPPHAPWRIAAIIALALLAFLIRTAGLSTVLAVGIWLWSRRSRQELTAYALSAVAVVGGWMGYTTWARKGLESKSYLLDFTTVPDTGGGNFIGQLIERTWDGAVTLGTRTMTWTLALPTVPGTPIDNVIWTGLTAVLLAIGVALLWQRWRAFAAFMLMYGLLLLAWPYTQDRLVGVVVPYIFLTMLLAVKTITGRLPGRAGPTTLLVFVVLLLIGNANRGFGRDADRRACNHERPYFSEQCYDVPERARGARVLAASGEYIRANAAPADIVVASKEASMYFLTGLRTISAGTILRRNSGRLLETLRAHQVRFVLVTFYFDDTDLGVARALLPDCSSVRVEASYLRDGLLLSLPGADSTATADASACAPLAEFIRTFSPS